MAVYEDILVACTHADAMLRSGLPIERVVSELAQMPLGNVSRALAAGNQRDLAERAKAHPLIKRLVDALSATDAVQRMNELRLLVLSEYESSAQRRAQRIKQHMGLLIFLPFAPLLVLLIELLGRAFTSPLVQPPVSDWLGLAILVLFTGLLLRFAWGLHR
ncbi:hypothetical protein D6789_00220 [Candidatus Woesearchaeota archaeon]|nr:MAG: hypothetical protein D6789_00220 [Candidatus Woesearchaeota archaeon]